MRACCRFPGMNMRYTLDGKGAVDVTLDLPAGRYSGEWLHPETGVVEGIQAFRHTGGVKVTAIAGLR